MACILGTLLTPSLLPYSMPLVVAVPKEQGAGKKGQENHQAGQVHQGMH